MVKNMCIVVSGAVVCLAGCTSTQTVSQFSPEDVLKQAAQATHSLESSQFVANVEFEYTSSQYTADGEARMDGIIQNKGEDVRFQVDFSSILEQEEEEDGSIQGSAEVIVLSHQETYLRVNSLSSQPSSTVFQPELLRRFVGIWWKLPAGEAPPAASSLTPDPELLTMQAQVVRTTHDNGITSINGIDAYHYDIEIDPQKLSAYLSSLHESSDELMVPTSLENIDAKGEIWINAETFFIERVDWHVRDLAINSVDSVTFDASVTLRNHNAAPAIVPPEQVEIFSPLLFMNPSLQIPQEVPVDNDVPVDSEAMDSLLQSLTQ